MKQPGISFEPIEGELDLTYKNRFKVRLRRGEEERLYPHKGEEEEVWYTLPSCVQVLVLCFNLECLLRIHVMLGCQSSVCVCVCVCVCMCVGMYKYTERNWQDASNVDVGVVDQIVHIW